MENSVETRLRVRSVIDVIMASSHCVWDQLMSHLEKRDVGSRFQERQWIAPHEHRKLMPMPENSFPNDIWF